MIDCFDPSCCEECPDHYYSDCDRLLCEVERPDNPEFTWKKLWSFSNDWINGNTPLVGTLRTADGPVIVGMSNTEVGVASLEDLVLVRGDNGDLLRRIPTPEVSQYASSIGLADVTGDGEGNIVIALSEDSPMNRFLQCYNPEGLLVWTSDAPHGYNSVDQHLTPQFTDFNADGRAEIFLGNVVFDGVTGRKLLSGGVDNHIGSQEAREPGYRFAAPVAADVLPDGFCPSCEGLELIAGAQVYAVDMDNEMIEIAANLDTDQYGDGFTAISDMNNDGALDIIVAQRIGDELFLYVWDPRDEQVLGSYNHDSPFSTTFSGGSSVPLLTDLNDNGWTDIVFSTSMELVALRNEGNGSFSPLWQIDTQDLSGRSGPVAFDFTGNGSPEIIHRGQDFLRVIRAIDGAVLEESACFSSTFLDKPTVANINSEPQAELLMSCGNNLEVFTSGTTPWRSARPVWNQLNYFNTHIEDDLTVPANMQPIQIPETGGERNLNRYLEQFSRSISPGPDFVFDNITIVCENGGKFLEMTVCNEGDLRSPVQLFIAAYAMNPIDILNPPAWNVQVPNFLDPGECVDLRYVFPPFGNLEEAYFTLNIPPGLPIIDTMDENSFLTPECNYDNNFELVDLSPYLIKEVNLGPDTAVCADLVDEIVLMADTTYRSYTWSTGQMTPSITVNQSGTYSLMVTDACGNQDMGEIVVTFESAPDLMLPSDTSACIGDTLSFAIDGSFEDAHWVSNGDTLCQNCLTFDLVLLEDINLELSASRNGCPTSQNIEIMADETAMSTDSVIICPGDSILIGGDWVGPGTYTTSFDRQGTCDSIAILFIETFPELSFETEVTDACSASDSGRVTVTTEPVTASIRWSDGSQTKDRELAPGTYNFELEDENGCLSTGSVTVEQIDFSTDDWLVEQPGCQPDSSGRIEAEVPDSSFQWFLNGDTIAGNDYFNTSPAEGLYAFRVEKNNCVFTESITIEGPMIDSILNTVTYTLASGDSLVLGNEVERDSISDIEWTPGTFLSCTDCIPVSLQPTRDIIYTLHALDESGCPIVKVYRIETLEATSIAIPNVFSPNGDGINDFFTISASVPIQELKVCRIFDRWGNLMAELQSGGGAELVLWDGRYRERFVGTGTYVYYIRLIDGNNMIREFAGDVTVTR